MSTHVSLFQYVAHLSNKKYANISGEIKVFEMTGPMIGFMILYLNNCHPQRSPIKIWISHDFIEKRFPDWIVAAYLIPDNLSASHS